MNKKTLFLFSTGIVMLATGILVAICVGAKNISLETVFNSIFAYKEELDMQLVRDVRLPRALSAAIVGGLLGMAGAMMQGVTRNPIAEPSIMGITQGATLAVAISAVSASVYGALGNYSAAFLGALISGILVLLFSIQSAANMSLSRLLLAGTAMSTFFISLASVIAMLGNRSQDLSFWIAGGFRAITWKQVYPLVIIGGICIILALTLSHKVNIVNLGEDVAIGLGVNPVKIRIFTILLLIPMCAVSVATAGNIAFVGLIVPHIIRKIVGSDYRKIMPLSLLFGAVLLTWSDILARMVNHPYETPIGLFTSIIGVPIFLLIVRKERG